jgi:RNA polymerase sigma-70 factor (ECF subfamily)
MMHISMEEEQYDPPDEPYLEKYLDRKELRIFLHEKMKNLPETYRIVLLMRYQNDLSYKEIASILDIPMGSVKTIIFRAKAELKELLTPHQEVVAWID